mmetsp:Transcript_28286/g.92332  ORF Transcript_28286/g.92332 Transcript_28286/m.92332 type:complete len:213 (-) Transcript_28286:178-816(-)
MASTASNASSCVCATTTPLPAARPSALTTIGAPSAAMYALASTVFVKRLYLAVGMSYLAHRSFMKPLEPSRTAAPASGPKVGTPAAVSASPRPATSGASGPITTNPTPSSSQKRTTAAWSFTSSDGTDSMPSSCCVPPFPGTAHTRSHCGDCRIFHASACSRPPFPTTSTFAPAVAATRTQQRRRRGAGAAAIRPPSAHPTNSDDDDDTHAC